MLRFRMASLTVSFVLSSALAFLAATHRIDGIFDPLGKTPPVIDVRSPPPPPPPPINPPPEVKPITPPPIGAMPEAANVTTAPVTDPYVAPPAPAPPAEIVGATWLKRPGAREFDRYYPERAVQREKDGRVVLNCTVNADGTINCAVGSETPEGWGFGEAAVQISRSFKMAPQTVNGQPTSGGLISVPITFRLGS